MHSHSTMHHHAHTHAYPVSSCRIEGTTLVVSRAGSASLNIPMADIRAMTFFVGTPARGTWHDFVRVEAGIRAVDLTSYGAAPGKVVPSRNAYRKFVLKLVKAVRARRPDVRLYVYGEGNAANRFLAIVLSAIAAFVAYAAIVMLRADGASAGPFTALACAAGLAYVAASQMRAAPARPIDPEREHERMVPPLDADA